MSWTDQLLTGIASISPVIGTALGGPVGGLIGQGVSAAAKAITGKESTKDILQDLTANPDKLAELEIQTQANELEELRIHAADRDSARSMSVELAKAGHASAWAAPIVSLIVTVGFFILLYAVLNMNSANVPEVAYMLLGALAAGFTQVLNYYLGSSKGSADKNNLLSRYQR